MEYTKVLATWWSGTCYHTEQLNAIIQSTDIKGYAYILHDKDTNENGELKKAHFHFLVQLYRNQRGSFFKQFATDDLGIVLAQPCYNPQSAFDYLIHATETAIKQGKFLYPESERTTTINLDDLKPIEKENENDELLADIIDWVENKITLHDIIKKKPKRLHMIGNICRAYQMFYFEKYGKQFFDLSRPIRHDIPPQYKVKHDTGELIPITDKKTLDDMPF